LPACPNADELAAFVLGALAETAVERVVQHLEACPACEARVRSLENLSDPVIAGLRRPLASGHAGGELSGRKRAGADGPGRGAAAGPLIPERLGDYRLLREVGRGGMGIVYEAEQASLGRRVALKVLPPHVLLDRERLQRFEREARAAA